MVLKNSHSFLRYFGIYIQLVDAFTPTDLQLQCKYITEQLWVKILAQGPSNLLNVNPIALEKSLPLMYSTSIITYAKPCSFSLVRGKMSFSVLMDHEEECLLVVVLFPVLYNQCTFMFHTYGPLS